MPYLPWLVLIVFKYSASGSGITNNAENLSQLIYFSLLICTLFTTEGHKFFPTYIGDTSKEVHQKAISNV